MGRTVVFMGQELSIPGVYSYTDVSRLLQPSAGGIGIVALVGESVGGKPGMHLFPGGSSPKIVKDELKSGPGANMVRLALRATASDPLVPGGASTVLFFKTNNSTQSQIEVGGLVTGVANVITIGCVADTLGSLDGKYFVIPDADGTVAFWIDETGTTIEPVHGADRSVKITTVASGDSANNVAIAVRSAISGDGAWTAAGTNPSVIATDIATGLRTGQSAGTSGFTVTQTGGVTADTVPQITIKTKQYGAFTALYTAAIATVGGGTSLTIRDELSVPESSPACGLATYFSLVYTGNGSAATAALSYVGNVLTLVTTVTGASDGSAAFSVDCTGRTLKQLAQIINAKIGYTAAILNSKDNFKVSDLDLIVTPVSIKTTATTFKAGIWELVDWSYKTSTLVDVIRSAENEGDKLPTTLASTQFQGGSDGSTSNSSVQDAFNALLSFRTNIAIPLFSSDDQDGSSVVIESVNSILKDHVENRSSILGRSECQGYVSISGNKQAFLDECTRLNSRRVAVTSQIVDDLDIDGNIVTYPEYAFPVVCAQIQSGSPVGTPLENRVLPVSGLTQDASWDSIRNGSEMVKGGCLFAAPDESNINRIVGGYECWKTDENNANIFIETVESLDIFAFNHRRYMKAVFQGVSKFSRQDVLNAIEQSETSERSGGSIKSYDSKLTNLIEASAGKLRYELAVEPWEGIRFILPTIIAIREA
jgi:hypothetical protein